LTAFCLSVNKIPYVFGCTKLEKRFEVCKWKRSVYLTICRKIVIFVYESKETMSMKTKELIKLLEDNGWVYQRTRGDHRVYYKAGMRRAISIPGKLNNDLKEGTCQGILRQAGIKETVRQIRNEDN
jgi:predicted RNA binding protein YcfA (HicA-like mRNA interferase family)